MANEEKAKRKITNAELDDVKNYLVIELAYNSVIILPYKEGIAVMASLEHAERVFMSGYNKTNMTFNTERFEIKTEVVTQAFYREQKMNHLLGVTDE